MFSKFWKRLKFNNFVFANLNYLGIFAPLKIEVVRIKIKISKTIIAKLVVFTALTGLAVLLDNYFEKNPVKMDELASDSAQTACEHGTIYLFSQGSSTTTKTLDHRTPDQKILQQSHNKLLQKYHQLRSYQVMKKKAMIQKPAFILTCHFQLFRNYHFTFTEDDVPLTA